jgi:hypothetical protein
VLARLDLAVEEVVTAFVTDPNEPVDETSLSVRQVIRRNERCSPVTEACAKGARFIHSKLPANPQ